MDSSTFSLCAVAIRVIKFQLLTWNTINGNIVLNFNRTSKTMNCHRIEFCSEESWLHQYFRRKKISVVKLTVKWIGINHGVSIHFKILYESRYINPSHKMHIAIFTLEYMFKSFGSYKRNMKRSKNLSFSFNFRMHFDGSEFLNFWFS